MYSVHCYLGSVYVLYLFPPFHPRLSTVDTRRRHRGTESMDNKHGDDIVSVICTVIDAITETEVAIVISNDE